MPHLLAIMGHWNSFCSLLGHLPSAKDPKKDMHACTDILLTVLKAHYITAACLILKIDDVDASPANFPELQRCSKKQCRDVINKLSAEVVERCSLIASAVVRKTVTESGDGVYNYARQFCHYASLALEFLDAWAEGDGIRVLRCWRVFLLHFHDCG